MKNYYCDMNTSIYNIFIENIFQIHFKIQRPEYNITDRPSLAQHNKAIIFNITSFPEKHNKKFHFLLTSMNHL